MLGRVGCGAMGMERLKRMFDTGDGRQAEWAIDRESLFVKMKIGSIRYARPRAGLFSENVPKLMNRYSPVSLIGARARATRL